MMAKALKGDSRAALALIQLTLGLEQSESGQPDQAGLEEEDLAIIENFKARMRGTNPVPPEDPADADKN
jgi:hypothetical protein